MKRMVHLILRRTPITIVALFAAYASWFHIAHVALRFGERPEVGWGLPLSIDGLMVSASIAMADDHREGRKPRAWARAGFWTGLTASGLANIAAAHSMGGRVISLWPAVALFFCVEIVARRGKLLAPEVIEAATQETSEAPVPDEVSVAPSRRRFDGRAAARQPDDAIRTKAAAMLRVEPALTREEIASKLGVGKDRLRRVLDGVPA